MEPHDHTQYTNDSPGELIIHIFRRIQDLCVAAIQLAAIGRCSTTISAHCRHDFSLKDLQRDLDHIKTSSWLLASSAAHHMTGDVNRMTDYILAPDDLVVNVPNRGVMRVHGSGSVRTAAMSLHNVMHVPGLDKSLVSTSQLAKGGYTVTLGPSGSRITKDQTVVGEAHFTEDYLFEVDFLRVPSSTACQGTLWPSQGRAEAYLRP